MRTQPNNQTNNQTNKQTNNQTNTHVNEHAVCVCIATTCFLSSCLFLQPPHKHVHLPTCAIMLMTLCGTHSCTVIVPGVLLAVLCCSYKFATGYCANTLLDKPKTTVARHTHTHTKYRHTKTRAHTHTHRNRHAPLCEYQVLIDKHHLLHKPTQPLMRPLAWVETALHWWAMYCSAAANRLPDLKVTLRQSSENKTARQTQTSSRRSDTNSKQDNKAKARESIAEQAHVGPLRATSTSGGRGALLCTLGGCSTIVPNGRLSFLFIITISVILLVGFAAVAAVSFLRLCSSCWGPGLQLLANVLAHTHQHNPEPVLASAIAAITPIPVVCRVLAKKKNNNKKKTKKTTTPQQKEETEKRRKEKKKKKRGQRREKNPPDPAKKGGKEKHKNHERPALHQKRIHQKSRLCGSGLASLTSTSFLSPVSRRSFCRSLCWVNFAKHALNMITSLMSSQSLRSFTARVCPSAFAFFGAATKGAQRRSNNTGSRLSNHKEEKMGKIPPSTHAHTQAGESAHSLPSESLLDSPCQ